MAVLLSSPLVLYRRYTTTEAKRQAWNFPANGFCRRKRLKRGSQIHISTTGNFPVVERVEDELSAIR